MSSTWVPHGSPRIVFTDPPRCATGEEEADEERDEGDGDSDGDDQGTEPSPRPTA